MTDFNDFDADPDFVRVADDPDPDFVDTTEIAADAADYGRFVDAALYERAVTELAFAIYLECTYQERLALNRVDAARGVCPGRVLTRRGWLNGSRELARYWFNSYPHCERAR